jgi:OmpA-OmpF porin, OOP family
MARLKTGPKLFLTLVVGAGLFFGLKAGMASGLIKTPGFLKSKKIESSTRLAENNDPIAASLAADVPKIALPSKRPVSVPGPQIRFERWFWNAHVACDLANGGVSPTEGSLTSKYGVNLKMVWNDVTPKLAENLVAFATELSNGNSQPSNGAHFVSIMGDQAAGFIGPINKQLKRLGADYVAEVVYSCGRSNGEDALMGPASWKSNPQNAVGGVVVTVVREGDWNIVVKWARDNNIPVNPDDKTYDPSALNFINTVDNNEAATRFVSGACEPRPIVKEGRRTGEEHSVCPQAASVWTPSDEVVAMQKGGIVRIVSTKEYSGQMPNVVIGIRKWNRENREQVVNMIRAFGEAGDQVLAYSDALYRGAEASSEIYDRTKNADYIVRYYTGVTQRDKQNTLVDLGGSRVHNLADNQRWFGLSSGTSNMFCASYDVFGNIVKELYPDFLPEFPACKEILNTDYLQEAIRVSGTTIAEAPTFAGGAVRDVVSSQKIQINFQTGSAGLTPSAERQLENLLQNLVVAGNLAIEIHGHTDNTGTVDGNQALSESRAFAVKQWLQQKAARDFPDSRFKVLAFGQSQPLETNASALGREKNRRVEIILGRQ